MKKIYKRLVTLIKFLERLADPNYFGKELDKINKEISSDQVKNFFNILKIRSSYPDDYQKRLLIYDVGMHTGQDTEFYLKKGFKVIAIEANPLLCEEAAEKFKFDIETGMLKIINKGISNRIGVATFYVNTAINEWSSFSREIAGRDGHQLKEIQIECISLAEIVETYGQPYYVKIDIEGYDEIAVKSLIENEIIPPYISVENGSNILLDLEKNYDLFKYVQQNNIKDIKPPFPPMEGKFTNHVFKYGSSGPFGEETSGRWKGFEEIFYEISRVWNVHSGEKNPFWDDRKMGWFDLHARSKDFDIKIDSLLNNKEIQ